MSYQVLARKWRPRSFPAMVGQEHVLRALINALDNDRLHHAFLFTGTRGVGKTTIARILAKSLNCERGVSSQPCGECSACREIDEGRFVDLIEVDAASRTKVEDTREILDNVQYAPSRGRYKVYLIDEVHMLSNHSFNALLKTLEEPPPHVKFLLATTDPQKLPVTILSRCLQFNLKRLPLEQIRGHLQHILQEEGIDAEAAAVSEIARAADGSMRDALSLLDQAIAHGGGVLEAAAVRAMLGTIDRTRVVALLRALAGGDPAVLLAEAAVLAELSPDYGGVLNELNSALIRIALVQAVPDALGEEVEQREALQELAQRISPEDVQLYYQIGLTGRRDLPLAPEPRGGFEMILLRMLAFRPAGGAGQGMSRPAAVPAARAVTSATSAAMRNDRVTVPPSPAATEAPAVPLPAVSRADLNWTALAASLPLGGLTRQLALNCALVRHDAEVIELALEPSQRALYNKKWEEALAKALSEHLGHAVRLTIHLDGRAGGETPMAAQQRRDQERQAAAQAAIEGDVNVQTLLERFGGRIEPGSVQPLE
ncbi:DNA polymerase III subunit gamma/tau [Sulfurivermis fontis]|uniref:DNA polymerase III subunit gamma/tau n=1 Tax=Sulfurivermis fontis TaxID=1972068 RepID=UPI000FD9461F|nr:DNA polymerase III subunit gamma/tau [Sulfurivermis fontis]